MSVAGARPEKGLRVALELDPERDGSTIRYRGVAHRPDADFPVALSIDAETGRVEVDVASPTRSDAQDAALDRAERSFLEQLARQALKLATQTPADEGGGRWPRRIQRWRGPK